jgi:hypothetical protein
MPHTFLALDMALIPQSTKDNIPTFWKGLFSNDNSRMLIDGYNGNRELVHPQQTLDAWLQWELDPQVTLSAILSSAIEYTAEEFKAERLDVTSIWYVEPEVVA